MVEEGEVLGGVLMQIACISAIFGLEKKAISFWKYIDFTLETGCRARWLLKVQANVISRCPLLSRELDRFGPFGRKGSRTVG